VAPVAGCGWRCPGRVPRTRRSCRPCPHPGGARSGRPCPLPARGRPGRSIGAGPTRAAAPRLPAVVARPRVRAQRAVPHRADLDRLRAAGRPHRYRAPRGGAGLRAPGRAPSGGPHRGRRPGPHDGHDLRRPRRRLRATVHRLRRASRDAHLPRHHHRWATAGDRGLCRRRASLGHHDAGPVRPGAVPTRRCRRRAVRPPRCDRHPRRVPGAGPGAHRPRPPACRGPRDLPAGRHLVAGGEPVPVRLPRPGPRARPRRHPAGERHPGAGRPPTRRRPGLLGRPGGRGHRRPRRLQLRPALAHPAHPSPVRWRCPATDRHRLVPGHRPPAGPTPRSRRPRSASPGRALHPAPSPGRRHRALRPPRSAHRSRRDVRRREGRPCSTPETYGRKGRPTVARRPRSAWGHADHVDRGGRRSRASPAGPGGRPRARRRRRGPAG
jgi:hypothetical protein